jgi:cholesterol oxidase
MARHALLLLGMGLDDADGNVTLEPEDGHLLMQVSWPAGAKGPRSPYYQALHRWLLDARDADGFDGGDYLPSPLWKPLPDDFEEIAGGAMQPQGLTVHPLGGCGMGDSVDTGVVDWRGTVFHADGSLLEGLHVLDGAMLPTAVGVNPFVTISALSWLAARDMQRQLELQPTVPTHLDTVHSHLPHFREQPRKAPRRATQTAEPLLLRFHEHLQGRWDGVRPVWLPPTPRDWSDPEKAREWVVSVEVQLDVSQWLADPAMRLAAHMRVFQNTHPHEISVRPEATRGVPVMEGNGWVSLLARDAPDGLVGEGWRMALAVAAFLQRRTMSEAFNLLSPKDASDVPADRTVQPPPKTVLQRVAGFARAARNHAQYRTLDYEFVLHAAGDSSQVLPLHGSKRLAYAPSEKNPWDALVQIELVMNAPQVRGALVVEADLIDMVRRRRLQVLQAPDTPAAIIGLAGFSALWLRSLFQTHFWSFRGLDYARLRPPPPARHGPLWPQGQDGLPCQPAVEKLMVPRRVPGQTQGAAEAPLQLELTRYSPAPANDPVKHLLMIHGLAHGATVFSTDTTGGRNMAAAFLADGYTVWLLDHRLSNRLGSTDAQGRWHGYAVQDHCMDDLARLDIAAAVTHVHRAAGQPIDVFAHCVGAGAFAMATLRGWLNDEEGHSRVRAALIHAVHPWVVPSASNQLSGELAALYRDFLPKDRSVNPVPPSGVGGAMDQVLDRVAASLPWPPQEMKAHLAHQFDEAAGTATCNRMTLFYGREWVHANLAEETHRQLASLVGPASVAVFQQLYHLVNRQHLTDRYGAEVYMREDQFNAHWQFPVMFCHGTENRVFDPRAAARSWHQLRMLQERQPRPDLPGRVVRLFMAEGYGHMDFLFGRDAHRDVYPSLVAFLRDPCAFEGTFDTDSGSAAACHARVPRIWRDHTPGAAVAPLTGPMLQLDHDGERRVLVIWVEMPNEPWQGQLSPMLQAVQGSLVTALAGWQATRLGGVYPPGGLQREVPLLQGPGAYWVIRLTEAPDQPFERLSLLQLAWANVGAEGVGSADDSMKPALIDLTRLPWWRAWVQSPSAAPAGNGVSWLATSCRWPGTPFERDAVDAVAARMLTHVQHPTHPVHALVMLGDQIYADATANLFTTQPDDEKLAQFYRDAWGSPHARELLAQLPAYFVVDDHEICDNWNGSLHPSDDETLLMGFEAALAYQWRWTDATRHAPQVTQRRVRGFWRTFQIGQLPAFAADTRTERQPRTAANWRHARMISATQMTALEQWLLQHRDQPKVLCSGSVLGWVEHALVRAPQQGVSSDSWGGFPASWRRLVRFIVRHQIRHIIFLTGDYHFSGVAELTLHADAGLPPVQAQSVVCSGWNASLPFANGSPGDYVTDSNVELPGSDGSARIVSHATTMGTALRQFSKLTVRQLTEGEWTLRVDVSGEGGELLARTDRRL